jgi:hypothetical protein
VTAMFGAPMRDRITRGTWAWFRIDAARRWRSLATIALLITASSGTVLTAAAGARRGASAFDRLSARTVPATAAVMPFQPGFDWAPIRAMPEVEALATYLDTDFQVDGVPADNLSVGAPPGTPDLMRTIDRPVLLQGRLADPTRPDEAVVTRKFVITYGKGVGDTVTAHLPTPQEAQAERSITGPRPGGPQLTMHIVGVVRSPWFSDTPQSHGTLLPTAALARSYRANLVNDITWFNALVRLKGGAAALPAFKAHLAAVTGRSDIDVRNLPEELRHRQRAAAFEARWLLAFGAVAFVAALVLVGQALARYVGASLTDLQVLRALGMTRTESVLAAVVGPLLAATAGAGGGVAVAVTASRWFPIGSAADAEPAPGVDVDALVLGIGGVLAVLLVLTGAALAARLAVGSARPRRPAVAPRRSSIATAAARLPVPVAVGTRFALEASRGPTAVPVRPAVFGAVAGVLGVVAAFTFSAGVTEAAGNPERFGQTWQLETWIGFGGTDFGAAGLLQTVARDPDVTAVNDWRAAVASDLRNRLPVLLYSYHPVGQPVKVVLTTGRMPTSATELVLAPESAAALRTRVGGTVTLAGTTGTPRALTVSGIGFVPAGSHCTACSEASGGWVTDGGFDTLFDGFQFHGGLIAVRHGARIDDVTTRLQRATATPDGGTAVFARPYPPFAAAEIRQVQALPLALGAFLALLAVGAVGHALATAVRRRRHDLAVLRALGMTRRQSRGVVATQASVLALVGLVFGIPLGVALGRTAWRVVADYTPLYYVSPVAFWALLLIGPLTLLTANLLATWPGRRAARLHLGTVLRAE